MKYWNTPKNQITRRILLTGCAIALAVAVTVSLPQPALAGKVTVPPVPDNIDVQQVAPGAKAFLEGHAVGTQNYICLPSGSGFAFILFTPQATLFNDDMDQLITHFNSPNLNPNPSPTPDAKGTIRATWENSRDTSTVWAKAIAQADHITDPTFVEQGAIAWVLLEVVGHMDGPTGGDRLSETTFVQRLNTHGGVAPSVGCSSLADVGTKAFVPYRASYFFYKGPEGDDDDN
jgi:hypothetical protein